MKDNPIDEQIRATHERIKYKLRLKGSSLSQIARNEGVTPAIMTLVCQRREKSKRLETIISEIVEEDLTELFPDRYHEEN